MNEDIGLDSMPWLLSDGLSGFSDLLDDEELHRNPTVTLGSSDLAIPNLQNLGGGADQGSQADWLKSIISGVAAPQPDASMESESSDNKMPFPGFPAAGSLTSVPISMNGGISQPVSCSRMVDNSFPDPSSWESSLSRYSLEDSLVHLPSISESMSIPMDRQGRKLKSENSFACSFDSYNDSLCQDSLGREELPARSSKTKSKEQPSVAKASLADRNRERQQRFRQRQKAKIETLESQVVKLTAQAKALNAEKEDLGGRALKYQDLLQGRDRALAGMTAQIAQLRCSGPPSRPLIPESQQLTLTYCNPSLVLNGAQLSKMDAVDLATVWKEYVWQLELLLPDSNSCQGQWTPTRERMDALTSELVQLMMHLWDACPDFSRIKAKGLVDESMQCEVSGSHRWQQIAHLLSLGPDQMNSLVALRTSMNSRLKQIWATRREAHANMFTCMEDELPCSRDVAVQHHRIMVQTDIVKESLKQESLLARDFDFAFYKKVLTPDQRALCIVRGYPYFPDTQALANWIAALNGNQEAHTLMTMHSFPSTTSYHSNS